MLDKGFWAEVEIAGEHLRLFSEDNAQGVQVSVYDVNAKCWIVPSEVADDIEEGKERAEEYATVYLQTNWPLRTAAADVEKSTLPVALPDRNPTLQNNKSSLGLRSNRRLLYRCQLLCRTRLQIN